MSLSWKLPPLHRHLSTIGVGAVFIRPPPHALPLHCNHKGDAYAAESSDEPSSLLQKKQKEITTWEIVGDIKSTPDDFIVREIGWAPGNDGNGSKTDHSVGSHEPGGFKHSSSKYLRRPGWSRRIAGLDCFESDEASKKKNLAEINEGLRRGGDGIVCLKNDLGRKDEDNVKDHGPTSTTKKARLCLETEKARETEPSTAPISTSKSSPSKPHSAAPPQEGKIEKDLNSSADPSPIDGLRRILSRCQWQKCHEAGIDSGRNSNAQQGQEFSKEIILKQLSDLQELALGEINSAPTTANDVENDEVGKYGANRDNAVWIPTSQLFQTSSPPCLNDADDWKLLHLYVRQAFPLLQTESSSSAPSNNDGTCSHSVMSRDDASGSKEMSRSSDIIDNGSGVSSKSWVRAIIDYSFFPLARYLSNPGEDLLLLYKFRNCGPLPAVSYGGNRNRSTSKHRKRWQKNKQNSIKEEELRKEVQPDQTGGNSHKTDQGIVQLRLRPDLPRSERRALHQTLASGRRRDFETSTVHDVPLDNADDNAKKTSAIIVQWSASAIGAARNKRKRVEKAGNASDRESSNITAMFCVLQKQQCEHQVAVQNLSQALRCRAGDIGLAGIKDMQANTYQFCTLRNVHLNRVQRANSSLGKQVQLSNCVEVQDFLLDRGNLLGNRFEITLRNLKRVQRLHVEEGLSWKERTVPLHASHLDAMTERVRDFGFVNFYGEQRCGDAGPTSLVGVRSFDVGRTMLQRDFSKAIDLIMTGRSNEVYSPGEGEIRAREVWKTSGGDARATLKAFPKNRNTMVRERDLMRGLLRYGDALKALRCVPHNVRMFWIHGYQAYVWNRLATERIKRYGLHPVVGDLYLKEDGSGNGSEDGTTVNVQVVSESGSVDISQVVLPLPGYNMIYPQNEIGELYRETLKKDGVDLSEKDQIPEATAKGSYRKLIQGANGLKWDVVVDEGEGDFTESEDRVVNAAKFTFELESGCYATMMLRELMVATMARDSKMEQSI